MQIIMFSFCSPTTRVVQEPPSNNDTLSSFSNVLCSWYSYAVAILFHLPAWHSATMLMPPSANAIATDLRNESVVNLLNSTYSLLWSQIAASFTSFPILFLPICWNLPFLKLFRNLSVGSSLAIYALLVSNAGSSHSGMVKLKPLADRFVAWGKKNSTLSVMSSSTSFKVTINTS